MEVIFGAFSQPLYCGVVMVGGPGCGVVTKVVGGVVDSVLQKGNGCELLLCMNVCVA